MTTFNRRNLLSERPADVPADSIIFNAPRPLFGTKTWEGEFCSGVFYASVAPDDPHRAWEIKQNRALAADVLAYVDPAKARDKIAAELRADYPDQKIGDDLIDECWRDIWFDRYGSDTVEI